MKKKKDSVFDVEMIDADYDVFPEQKSSQKAKGSFGKYKVGGHLRSLKRK